MGLLYLLPFFETHYDEPTLQSTVLEKLSFSFSQELPALYGTQFFNTRFRQTEPPDPILSHSSPD